MKNSMMRPEEWDKYLEGIKNIPNIERIKILLESMLRGHTLGEYQVIHMFDYEYKFDVSLVLRDLDLMKGNDYLFHEVTNNLCKTVLAEVIRRREGEFYAEDAVLKQRKKFTAVIDKLKAEVSILKNNIKAKKSILAATNKELLDEICKRKPTGITIIHTKRTVQKTKLL